MTELFLCGSVGPASWTGKIGIGSEVYVKEKYLLRYWWMPRCAGRIVGCVPNTPFCIAHQLLVEWEEKPGVHYPTLLDEIETLETSQ